MSYVEQIKRKITGKPHLTRSSDSVQLSAVHRLPSSGDEIVTVFRIVGVVGAAAILVAHYSPDAVTDPNANIFLDIGNRVVAGLTNAIGRLGAVVDHQALDVPLESLRGWALALGFLGGVAVFRRSGLFDFYTYLTNREQIRIEVDGDHLTMRRGMFGLRSKRIARDSIQDVLILPNHKTGHDVMLQHGCDLTRLASIHGDLTRPTLFKLKLQEALTK